MSFRSHYQQRCVLNCHVDFCLFLFFMETCFGTPAVLFFYSLFLAFLLAVVSTPVFTLALIFCHNVKKKQKLNSKSDVSLT